MQILAWVLAVPKRHHLSEDVDDFSVAMGAEIPKNPWELSSISKQFIINAVLTIRKVKVPGWVNLKC